jgi:hypothetical protein
LGRQAVSQSLRVEMQQFSSKTEDS